ncbi:hypothetical protein LNKW23_37480 [Paralimibaculum aggregatum]|uniref:Flavin reductase like domain-containing protein n=1 Tax=Paralimibaculum aggregatum TaxID=3036245 RepID=A0ABQ6LQW1_9RHOB|nr:flavin reductase family protein [Limibaculum sp. NKW23]GMG84532.1 hypothetical protein LNKW23_37480 [Limibaculum sp. NKW23]
MGASGCQTPPGDDPMAQRRAFGAFAAGLTGVTVETTRETDGAPRGFTANPFTSVALDPPLVPVCIATSAGSGETFREAGGFAVNIPAAGQCNAA